MSLPKAETIPFHQVQDSQAIRVNSARQRTNQRDSEKDSILSEVPSSDGPLSDLGRQEIRERHHFLFC